MLEAIFQTSIDVLLNHIMLEAIFQTSIDVLLSKNQLLCEYCTHGK